MRDEEITPHSIAFTLKRCARLAAELPIEVALIRDVTIEQLTSAAQNTTTHDCAGLGERLVDLIPDVLNDPRLEGLAAKLTEATANIETRGVPIAAITGIVAPGTAVTAYLFVCVVAASYCADGPLGVPSTGDR